MGIFDKILDFVDELTDGDSAKYTEKARITAASFRAVSKTMDEEGVFKTLSGESTEKLERNLLSEFKKPYYESWLKLKEDSTNMSKGIVRYIWALNQADLPEGRKYLYEAVNEIKQEGTYSVQKSIDLMKKEYCKLYTYYQKELEHIYKFHPHI